MRPSRSPSRARPMRLTPGLLALLLLVPACALAQEPMTILQQKEWSAGGVCIAPDKCGFCWASAAVEPNVTLRVEPPNGVSVNLLDRPAVASGSLEIAGMSF